MTLILGICDGHDAGACLICDGKALAAVSEERLDHLRDLDVGGVWLKGVVGRYHQPPRLFIPVPGVDASSLSECLLCSAVESPGSVGAPPLSQARRPKRRSRCASDGCRSPTT